MTTSRRVALVTGAAGFAGTHLIRELASETDWEIVGLVLRTRPADSSATYLTCDLLDRQLVARVFERRRPDIVFHLAAQTYVPQSFVSPGETLQTNILAQVNVLEACRSSSLDPFVVIASSSECYGLVDAEDHPIGESQPFRPVNPYAVSKATQDLLGFQYAFAHHLRIVRMRPFNHFGPGQSDRFVMSNFARQVAEAELGRIEPVILTGDLSSQRDFLDVRDVVRAYRLAVDGAVPGEAYNVASGVGRTIRDLLDRLIGMATMQVDVRQDPARLRPADVPRIVGDAHKLHDATGWAPRIPIEQSLKDTLDYWRAALS